ncbi:MAG: hypothetical protein ACYDD1_08065, partial [Caulobacteraceae bacterium]
ASHTFSAPHIMSPDHMPPDATPQARPAAPVLQAAVLSAVQQAAEAAVRRERSAHLSFGSASSDVNISRDVQTAQGWWLGSNEAGPSDKTLEVARLDDDGDHTLALLVNYAVQSSILNESVTPSGGRAISADLGGAAMARVEGQYPGAVSLFLTGAAGDQAPTFVANRYTLDRRGGLGRVDLGEKGFALVDLLGERLADDADRAAETASPTRAPPRLEVINRQMRLHGQARPAKIRDLHATRAYDFGVAPDVNAPFSIFLLGDVAIVGVQVELSVTAGERIRRMSPFPHTMVVTMVNGAAKYMPDKDSYDRITYEAMNSSFAKGSAETFCAQIVQALNALQIATPQR